MNQIFLEKLDLKTNYGFKNSYNKILDYHKKGIGSFVGQLPKNFSFIINYKKNFELHFPDSLFNMTLFEEKPVFNILEEKFEHEFDVVSLASLAAIFNYDDAFRNIINPNPDIINDFSELLSRDFIYKSLSLSRSVSLFYLQEHYAKKEYSDIFGNVDFYNTFFNGFLPFTLNSSLNFSEKQMYVDLFNRSEKKGLSSDFIKSYHKYILLSTNTFFEKNNSRSIYDDSIISKIFFTSFFGKEFPESISIEDLIDLW